MSSGEARDDLPIVLPTLPDYMYDYVIDFSEASWLRYISVWLLKKFMSYGLV